MLADTSGRVHGPACGASAIQLKSPNKNGQWFFIHFRINFYIAKRILKTTKNPILLLSVGGELDGPHAGLWVPGVSSGIKQPPVTQGVHDPGDPFSSGELATCALGTPGAQSSTTASPGAWVTRTFLTTPGARSLGSGDSGVPTLAHLCQVKSLLWRFERFGKIIWVDIMFPNLSNTSTPLLSVVALWLK